MNSNKTNRKNAKCLKKHDVNLRKNSRLYFQIGLIVVLLFSYAVVEAQFRTSVLDIGPVDPEPELFSIKLENFKVERSEEPLADKPKTKNPNVLDIRKEVPDQDPNDDKPLDFVNPVVADTIVDPNHVEVIEPTEPIDTVILKFLDELPVFPGCEDAKDKLKCFQENIDKKIRNDFDADVAVDFDLSGMQTILVNFKIDQNGNVIDVRPSVRGRHSKTMNPKAKLALMKEAERVVKKLPQFTPGKQQSKPVIVPYTVPIKIMLED